MKYLNHNGQKVISSGQYLINSVDPVVLGDWFLPAVDTMTEMYNELADYSVGGFSNEFYWASSEVSATSVYAVSMASGGSTQTTKNSLLTLYTRACRIIETTAGTYSIRDTGPGGGLIFYINGTSFYEAASADQSTTVKWSDVLSTEVGTGTEIGDGLANTIAIVAQSSAFQGAAKVCDDLN